MHNFTYWEIEQCRDDQNGCITGEYLIEIDLNQKNRYPKVYEVGEKIESLANKLTKKVIDLHLFPQDHRCCLNIISTKSLSTRASLSDFIHHDVYPYFVWQSYYYKYRKIPPCGESPHSTKEALEEEIEDREKRLEFCKSEIISKTGKTGRNDLCLCGSGKKYKKCCLSKHEPHKIKINQIRNELVDLNKIKRQSKNNDKHKD